MNSKTHNITSKRCTGRSLIATKKIKPDFWFLSKLEIREALEAQGYKVKEIRKVRYLKHQICISYQNKQGGTCSGFFSYRIFWRWQNAVERLIKGCSTLKEWVLLNYTLQYEFAHYPYPSEMVDIISTALENRLCRLKANTTNPDALTLAFLQVKQQQPIKKPLACIP
ncbi:MAG: hypothetical protein QNJ47_11405 [Nostocaceae cyanobacterium]|nr:hypothetical protein [Nostocaceae cyanobacterium]